MNNIMIEKESIDMFFATGHTYLMTAIKKTKVKYHRGTTPWKPDELMSDTYMHLIANSSKMTSTSQIESFFMRYMTNQIVWANSKINLLYVDKKQTAMVIKDFNLIDDEDDLNIKILLEADYNNKKAILFDFYQQLPTKQEQIMFEVIFKKGIKTVKALAIHFGINRNYIQVMKKKLFDDLNEYIQNTI